MTFLFDVWTQHVLDESCVVALDGDLESCGFVVDSPDSAELPDFVFFFKAFLHEGFISCKSGSDRVSGAASYAATSPDIIILILKLKLLCLNSDIRIPLTLLKSCRLFSHFRSGFRPLGRSTSFALSGQ